MKRIAIAFLAWVTICAASNVSASSVAQPEDGIYLRAQAAPAPQLVTQDGRTVFLGKRRELAIQESQLTSHDNANTRFSLMTTIPYDKPMGPSSHLLLVGGTAYRQSGSSGRSSLHFDISGEDHAQKAAEYLTMPVCRRTHPQHTLLVTFTPAKKEFDIGGYVTVTLRIKNIGTNTIAFLKGSHNPASQYTQYIFSAYHMGHMGKQVKYIGSSQLFGHTMVRRVLKPGEVFEDTIRLNQWLEFSEPGLYSVHGSYYLSFTDLQDKSWRTIWEDYVSADFYVNIKTPEKDAKDSAGGFRNSPNDILRGVGMTAAWAALFGLIVWLIALRHAAHNTPLNNRLANADTRD